ncbi:hypothetical protein KY359_01830 [Candidatus Woesearchaeota archaeon]|nr:hypothetical protein [Candidatus Woesearchaeota archaeon]
MVDKFSFGSRFESRGDYARAKAAYEQAGMHEDSERVGTLAEAVEYATLFEENGFHQRSVDTLLRAGLRKEANDLVSRVLKEQSLQSDYACLKVFAQEGKLKLAEQAAARLQEHAPKGLCVAAMAVADTFPERTKYLADKFSGKPVEVPTEPEKAFFIMVDPEKTAKQMVSLISWSWFSQPEAIFNALRMYQAIGLDAEAEGCLNVLAEFDDDFSKDFHSYGVLALRDVAEIDPDSMEGNARFLYGVASGDTETIIEKWQKLSLEARHKSYARLLWDVLSHVPEKVSDADFAKLICAKEEVREALAGHAKSALAEIDADILSGDFTRIKAASEMLRNVGFNYLARDRHEQHTIRSEYSERCAEAAYEIQDNIEAQAFAGDFFDGRDTDKAFSCAERLMNLGAVDEAKNVYSGIASYLAQKERDQKRIGLVPLRNGSHARLYSFLAIMDPEDPVFSLRRYQELYDRKNVERLAEQMIQSSDMAHVEEAAWKLSIFRYDPKRPGEKIYSQVLRPALQKLTSFGEAGMKAIEMIKLEMCIPDSLTENLTE